MATLEDQVVVWDEWDFAHAQPLRTATLAAQGSSFHLLRDKGGQAAQFWARFTSAFLPEGYPDSVTSDYLHFQVWDTLQGLSTYIRSMLSTQALLSGIGVGQTKATVMGATFQWFLRDFTGMLGGVVFTIYQGSNLDSKAKQWRLAADFMNDIGGNGDDRKQIVNILWMIKGMSSEPQGMLMDLVSPLFPKLFVSIVCIGSLARSVTGVASGATRAALTQHFALQQNAADLSAKEGSQETAATLTGMLLGMLLANVTRGHTVVLWICFLTLTGFHLYANYKAVRCVRLTSLNKERTKIALQTFFTTGKVLSPADVSGKEVLLPRFYVIKNFGCDVFHNQRIILGARISKIEIHGGWKRFPEMVRRYSKGTYVVILREGRIYVILYRHATRDDFLKSYVHALVIAILLQKFDRDDAEIQSCVWMETTYSAFLTKLQASGWNVNRIHVVPESWRADWSSSTMMDMKSE